MTDEDNVHNPEAIGLEFGLFNECTVFMFILVGNVEMLDVM